LKPARAPLENPRREAKPPRKQSAAPAAQELPAARATPARAMAAPPPVAPALAPSRAPEHLSRPHTASQAKPSVVRDALAAYVLGDLEKAHQLYRRAVKDAPLAPEAWRGLGIVAARRGQYAEAKRALARYLELSPRAPDAPAVQARSNALP
jgi:Flp pilus assembly protein TadD